MKMDIRKGIETHTVILDGLVIDRTDIIATTIMGITIGTMIRGMGVLTVMVTTTDREVIGL
jgi:hypothetical protein